MSAVAAALRTDDAPIEPAAVRRMVNAMASRAPDGTRVLVEGAAGLAHGALVATPESAHEQLPLRAQSAGLAITADARLDNRGELVKELAVDPRAGDGELILAAYERWAEACPERLLGDFAFAIWDAHREQLFCARDRIGIKQLYWYRSPALAAVATEIKALFAIDEVPRRLNEARFADFLCLQVEEPTETTYRDIYRLRPAHTLVLSRSGARLRRYWELDPERSIEGWSDAEYEAAFRQAFVEAVRGCLRAEGPVGAMLSGGMDSSSIVVTARSLLEASGDGAEPLHTLSAIFDAVPGTDEREYIDAVLRENGLEPHHVRPERFGPLDDWEGAGWRGDEPEPNPQASIARTLYGAAAERGIHCLLDGLGGDFVVSFGAERLTELARRFRWLAALREARAFGRKADFATTGRLLRVFVISPFVPAPVVRVRRSLRERRTGLPDWAGAVPVRTDFARRARLRERYAEMNRGRDRDARHPRRAQRNGITSAHVAAALGILDRTAAGLAIEPRYPFLDSRLVELCLAVPAEQKLRDGYNRDLLRRALADLLPPEIRWRTGKGRPGAYIEHSLPTKDRRVMDEVLLGDPGPIANYVDMARVRRMYDRCLQGADGNTWFPVFRVVTAALWISQARERFGLTV